MRQDARFARGGRLCAAALCALTACTSTGTGPAATPAAPPATTPAATPAPGPTPAPRARFDVDAALRTIRRLATGIGPREAASDAYREAAGLVARRFSALGYTVARQRFAVRGGTVDGVAVEAGSSINVVAEPPDFDERRAHLVVGAHLDSVPDSPGALDNASGVALVLELARMAAIEPPPLPVVFVAFGAEERRRQSPTVSQPFAGSAHYVASMPRGRTRALRGMLNLDMVGGGGRLEIIGLHGRVTRACLVAARRRDLDAVRRPTLTDRYSDHVPFEEEGYPVAFLHTGDHPAWHTPSDRPSIIEPGALRRVAAIAWDALRRLRR